MSTSNNYKNIGGIHYLTPVKIVIATGGFDPIHEGHIAYLAAAKRLGDILVVGINSDKWLTNKKGFVFQSYYTRRMVISSLRFVDMVIDFTDEDGSATCAITATQRWYGTSSDFEYIFVNGGDRTADNIPEMNQQYDQPVKFVFGVGGNYKLNSSSELVKAVQNGN